MVHQIKRFAKVQTASFTKEALWPFGPSRKEKEEKKEKEKEKEYARREKQKRQREDEGRAIRVRKNAIDLQNRLIEKVLPNMKEDLNYLYNVLKMNLERIRERKKRQEETQEQENQFHEQHDELQAELRKLQNDSNAIVKRTRTNDHRENSLKEKLQKLEKEFERFEKNRYQGISPPVWPKDLEPILKALQSFLFSLDALIDILGDRTRKILDQICYEYLEPLLKTMFAIVKEDESALDASTIDHDLEPFIRWLQDMMQEEKYPQHREKQQQLVKDIDFEDLKGESFGEVSFDIAEGVNDLIRYVK